MRPLKSVFGIVAALLPVAYCGGLFFYFKDFKGWSDGPIATGLGPTMLGLGAVGLLFCIPLVLKLIRLGTRAAVPGSVPGSVVEPAESGFDADAALARYMAKKAAGLVEVPPTEPMQRPSFGRKTV